MSALLVDRFEAARAVADAVLYEGYVLYPYRASSQKNRLRFQFGVLVPLGCATGEERSAMRTECLLDAQAGAHLSTRVRFLQLQRREVEQLDPAGSFEPVEMLEIDGTRHLAWDEGIERVLDLPPLELGEDGTVFLRRIECCGVESEEALSSKDGTARGRFVRRAAELSVSVEVSVDQLGGGRYKVALRIENDSEAEGDQALGARDRHVLVGAHAMLAIDGGAFLSLLDPPEGAERAAAECHRDGLYPVLIGGDDVVLAAPIILYDHPEVARESPGDLCDATEIDEILALRVLTLTEEEKAEARATDARAARIIDRCDDLSEESWERLHGTMRPVGELFGGFSSPLASDGSDTIDLGRSGAPAWWDPGGDAAVDPERDTLEIDGAVIHRGSAVILRPSRRADAQDLFLAGQHATVAGIFNDVDGHVHVAVSLDDDPATTELSWQGRHLYFGPEEIEPLPSGAAEP